MKEPHAHCIHHDSDAEKLNTYYKYSFRDGKDAMVIGIHEGVGIEMGFSVGHNGDPCPKVYENYIEGRIYHPGKEGIPVHVSLVYKKNVVDKHEYRDEIVENVVIERKMFIADVIEAVSPYGSRPNDQMVHEGKGPKAGSHDIAAVSGVEEWNIRPEKGGPQPYHEQGECGKSVILDS